MAHVYTVPPIPGVEDLYSLLTFLTDPDKYKDQLDKLEGLRAEVNGLIEKVGKADEIEALQGQAATARHLAGEALSAAKISAGALVAAARDEAYRITQDAEKDAARREATIKADMAVVTTRQAEIAADARALADSKEDVAKLRSEAERLMTAAKALKEEYDAKVARVKAAGL